MNSHRNYFFTIIVLFFTIDSCLSIKDVQTNTAQNSQSSELSTSPQPKTDDLMYDFVIQDTQTGLMLTANLTLEKHDFSNKMNYWKFRSMGIHAHSFYQQIIHGHSKKCLQITKTAQGQTMQLVPCQKNDLSQFYRITGDRQFLNGYHIENYYQLHILEHNTTWFIGRAAPALLEYDPLPLNPQTSSIGSIVCPFINVLLQQNINGIDSWQIHPSAWASCSQYRQKMIDKFQANIIIEQGSSTKDPSYKQGRNLLEEMRGNINLDDPNVSIDMMYIQAYDVDANGVVTQNEDFRDRIAFFKEHYPMIKNISYAFGPQDYRDVWLHGYRFETFQDIKKAIDIADGVVIDGTPALFIDFGPTYREIIYDAIRYARSQNKVVGYVLSPGPFRDPSHFVENSLVLKKHLIQNQVIPDSFIVEDYGHPPTTILDSIFLAKTLKQTP